MPQPDNPEIWGKVIFWCYVAAGLPIVWWHHKRENTSSKDGPDKRSFNFAIILLAIIWPILLLAILASWIGNKLDKPPSKK